VDPPLFHPKSAVFIFGSLSSFNFDIIVSCGGLNDGRVRGGTIFDEFLGVSAIFDFTEVCGSDDLTELSEVGDFLGLSEHELFETVEGIRVRLVEHAKCDGEVLDVEIVEDREKC
jgi:hypothetical protein